MSVEDMEAHTGPIEVVVDNRNDDYKHFYHDDAYYQELRDQAFLNTFFVDNDDAEASGTSAHRKKHTGLVRQGKKKK
jgi:hypothetical protein